MGARQAAFTSLVSESIAAKPDVALHAANDYVDMVRLEFNAVAQISCVLVSDLFRCPDPMGYLGSQPAMRHSAILVSSRRDL
jgi:hypothetical protein